MKKQKSLKAYNTALKRSIKAKTKDHAPKHTTGNPCMFFGNMSLNDTDVVPWD